METLLDEARQMADREYDRYLARKLGYNEGHAEGQAEGREEGLVEGREEGLAKGREMIRSFRDNGVPLELISKCSGLSVEEIKGL